MIRWASRRRRAIWAATCSGSSCAQPSEKITTTAPRASPRRPCSSTKRRRLSAIRVPPAQSGAEAAARARASSGSRRASCRVSRVSRVEKTKASAPAAGHRPLQKRDEDRGRRVPSSRKHRTAAPVCGAARGGGHTAAGWCRYPDRRAARTVARTSSRALLWADLRGAAAQARAAWRAAAPTASRRTSSTSASVESSAKDVSCRCSSADAMARTASRSARPRLRGAVPARGGHMRPAACRRAGRRASGRRGLGRGGGCVHPRGAGAAARCRAGRRCPAGRGRSKPPRNTAAKTASNTGTCSRADTSTTRQVQ